MHREDTISSSMANGSMANGNLASGPPPTPRPVNQVFNMPHKPASRNPTSSGAAEAEKSVRFTYAHCFGLIAQGDFMECCFCVMLFGLDLLLPAHGMPWKRMLDKCGWGRHKRTTLVIGIQHRSFSLGDAV
jgi:hypothetical protein